MKKIIALVLVLVLMLPLATSCEKVAKKPAEALSDAMDISAENHKDDRSTEVMNAALNGGSVEFSMDLTDILSLISSTELENKIGLNLKSYMAEEGVKSTSVLGLLIDGRALLEANLFRDTEKIVLTSEELLGSNAYGATIADITKLLEDNVPGLSEMINQDPSDIAANVKLAAIVSKYVKLLYDTVFEVCPAERTKGELTIGGETVEAVSFKSNVTAAQMAEVLKKVYEAFKADEDSKKFIEKYIADNGLNEENVDIFKELDEGIAELEDSAAELEGSFDVRLDFNAKVGNLMQVHVDFVDGKHAGGSVTLILGVDHQNPKYSALLWNVAEDDLKSMKLEYRVVEDTETKSMAEVTFEVNMTETNVSVTATCEYDKTTGQYKVEITLPESAAAALEMPGKVVLSITGQSMTTKDSVTFSVDDLSMNVGSMMNFNLNISAKLVVRAKDSGMPTAPESFKDITNEAVQTEFANEVETNIGEVISMLPESLLALFA